MNMDGGYLSSKPVCDYRYWKLYHGTSRDNAREILKDGFNSPTYFTREKNFAKQFGQAVFEIEIEMPYVNSIDALGNEVDEVALDNIGTDRIKKIYFYRHKPKYHNRIDYIRMKNKVYEKNTFP